MSEQREIPEALAFTEAEAAKRLGLKNERGLREMRYKRFKRGVHYAKIGKTVLYSREHIHRILHIDEPRRA